MTIVFLAALVISLNLMAGSESLVLFFHINVAAGIMLLTRDAYVAIAGLALVTFALGAVSGMAWSPFRRQLSACGRPLSSARSLP